MKTLWIIFSFTMAMLLYSCDKTDTDEPCENIQHEEIVNTSGPSSNGTNDGNDPEDSYLDPENPNIEPVESDSNGDGSDISEPSYPNVPESYIEKAMSDGKICILAIGNSFSQDAIENFLSDMFKSAGIYAVIANLNYKGCTLEQHCQFLENNESVYSYYKLKNGKKSSSGNYTLQKAITNEDWDFITLQQGSSQSFNYSYYNPYLGKLISWIKSQSDATLFFHQTWAYDKDYVPSSFGDDDRQIVMYQKIAECSRKVLEDFPEIEDILPVGTAIQNGRTSFLGDTFNRDGYHLQYNYGRFTAAAVWYEKFSGLSILDSGYSAPYQLNSRQEEVVKKAAHYANENPFEITDLSDL